MSNEQEQARILSEKGNWFLNQRNDIADELNQMINHFNELGQQDNLPLKAKINRSNHLLDWFENFQKDSIYWLRNEIENNFAPWVNHLEQKWSDYRNVQGGNRVLDQIQSLRQIFWQVQGDLLRYETEIEKMKKMVVDFLNSVEPEQR